MSWPVVTLDSIKADVPYACVGGPFGSNLTSKHYVDEGVPVIRGQNLGGPGCFNEAGFVFVTPEKADKLRPNLAFRGDLLFTQRGTLGQVGLIPQDSQYERYVVSQSQMKLTVDANRVDARFVYQYFRLPSTIQEILNRTITAGVPHINLGILKAFEIPLPPLSIQRAIAEVAQTYDDLIATNQRRIALLEDAARRLYREWFVHLRFPGHESVPVKDGVPEGWQVKSLGEVATLNYGKALKATDRKDGKVPVYGSSGIVGTHNQALVEGGSIVVGRKGNVGSLFFSPVPCFPIDTVFYIAPAQASYRTFLALHQLNFISSDAAVPGLNRTYAHSLPILQPSEDVAATFERLVQPVFEQSQHLTEQNAQLARTRDLLLPKLMSGQLDVSGIRLPDEVAA